MSNRRNAERAAFNAKLEQERLVRLEELKRDIARREEINRERRLRNLVRKYNR